MAGEDFFTERADQSEVKARIVSKYFIAWARIIASKTMRSDGKVAYIDLFAGPGRYQDGSASTPLMVLSEALKVPTLCDGLVSIFNDDDEDHTQTLENEIAQLPGIANFKNKPHVYTGQINRTAAEYFQSTKIDSCFFFYRPVWVQGIVVGPRKRCH